MLSDPRHEVRRRRTLNRSVTIFLQRTQGFTRAKNMSTHFLHPVSTISPRYNKRPLLINNQHIKFNLIPALRTDCAGTFVKVFVIKNRQSSG